jgi:2-dehydropantoate 2-reductase
MKFAVIGVGGIGGYFGARLVADGNEVSFIARGAHAEAMRRDGLRLASPLGDLHIADPHVPEDLGDIGLADIVLFCVKLWDVDAAAEQIKPLLGHDTMVVPFQNGVSVCDRLAELLGAGHVVGGVAKISATIESPGVIRHNGPLARLIFGERDGTKSWRMEAMAAACTGAGIAHQVADDIGRDIWEKFVFLAPLAGACCFARAQLGEVMDDPRHRARLAAMMAEAAAVGRAKGIALDGDLAERTLSQTLDLGAKVKPSMLVDLENGRRLELEWLNGEIVRLGQELGVPTPVNAEVYETLKPFAMGADAR